jgi:hypothetical protein
MNSLKQIILLEEEDKMMRGKIYPIHKPTVYRKAGPTDLIEMLPVAGGNALYLQKSFLEAMVYGIVNAEFIHLSGPTGSAKSSAIEALYREPKNFETICNGLGYPLLPLKVWPVEMVIFEAPGELFQRRALHDGSTYDELSILVKALKEGASWVENGYALIWLREMGRVHSSSVQGGLLNLMTKGDILLPDGGRIEGRRIAWIADSNYQADGDDRHELVLLDDALNRRFTLQLNLDYLPAEQEEQVLHHLLHA